MCLTGVPQKGQKLKNATVLSKQNLFKLCTYSIIAIVRKSFPPRAGLIPAFNKGCREDKPKLRLEKVLF